MMNIKISTMMLCHYTCQNSTTTEILIEALEASVFTLAISSHLNVARPLLFCSFCCHKILHVDSLPMEKKSFMHDLCAISLMGSLS